MALRDNIRRVVPYTPGEQPKEKVIKLNTNECPYPPSEKVIKALREADYDRLRLYPDPACTGFISALSEYYGVDENKIFVGVGSDDVLSMCFLTFFNGNKPVLFPDITYSFYDVWAEVYRIPYRQIPLREDFTIDPKDYRAENGGIVIANPNAPTGIAEKRETIETIIRDNPESVVIVDEAYVDFGGETVLDLIDKYSNLVVVRTMSKSRAMAGMRLGYAFGDAELIKYLNDVKFSVNSYTLNMPSLIAGEAAIRDRGYFEEITEKVKATRERVKKELKDRGFEFADSSTNFIFASNPRYHASEIFEKLKKKGIYVRYFNKPRISEYLRISVGTDEQMDVFIRALDEIMG
ncbi:MAG: histidinol-phosphate transaminase [Lachnospiraceae bacterium]|nr:histidinol-phosphate transaminase [Lachnospiraceae bacterium]